MPVLTAFSWTCLPFCSLQLSGNMLPGLIPFPTPQGDPLLLGVVYSPLFSSVHSPLFILQKQAVRVPLCSVSESSTSWTPKSSCVQMPSLSRIQKPVCLLNSFLLPATTQILKRKHLGLLVWDFLYYWGWGGMSSDQWIVFPVGTRGHARYPGRAAGSRGKKGSLSPSSGSELLDWLSQSHDTTTWAKIPQALVSRTLLLERKEQQISCLDRFVTRITEIPFKVVCSC